MSTMTVPCAPSGAAMFTSRVGVREKVLGDTQGDVDGVFGADGEQAHGSAVSEEDDADELVTAVPAPEVHALGLAGFGDGVLKRWVERVVIVEALAVKRADGLKEPRDCVHQ